MNKYLLDTHILLWLLEEDSRLNEGLREDIDYFQHLYYVSAETLREIVILQLHGKISLKESVDEVESILTKRQITLIPTDIDAIKALEKLPVLKIRGSNHEDPFDRLLIAQAIAGKYTIISADTKFPPYRKCGLNLLHNAA